MDMIAELSGGFMSISTINTTRDDIELKSRVDAFRKNEANLTQEELVAAEAQAQQNGSKSQALLKMLAENYDSIDLNGDGVSLTELQTYASNGKLTSSQQQSVASTSSDGDLLKYLDQDDEDESENQYSSLSNLADTIQGSYKSSSSESDDLLTLLEKFKA